MAIEELLALVPPPPRINERESVLRRQEVEEALGTMLPAAYWEFGRIYGTGQFEDGTFDFWLLNPLSSTYLEEVRQKCDLWRFRREAFPEEFPAGIFPAVPGLLPWGHDIDGGMMGWFIATLDPESWSVVTKGTDDESFEQFDMPFTTFLAKALRREIRPRIWRPDYPEDIRHVVFRPSW